MRVGVVAARLQQLFVCLRFTQLAAVRQYQYVECAFAQRGDTFAVADEGM